MKRWNGWGDTEISLALPPSGAGFLQQRLGASTPPQDATLEQVCAQVAPSRLPPHTLVQTDAPTRVRHSRGQSLPDWLALRYGVLDSVTDGVAFVHSRDEVRALLDYARHSGAQVIAYGGGTSVAGHINPLSGAAPILTISLARLSQLQNLDRSTKLATFGAGVLGPDMEAQLRAQGYTLGHFPQSFEYSSLGGWVATRSSGQQSLRYGRIEQLLAGAHVETPIGPWDIATYPASAAGTDLREMLLGSEGRLGIITEATVRVSQLPACEQFHAVFFPDWEAAQEAVRTLAQARLPLSMLRLSNATETLTTLALAGHERLIAALERYLGWRGCASGKCLLLLGASGTRGNVRAAICQALALTRQHQGVHLGQSMGHKWKHNRFRSVYLRNTLWQLGYAVDTAETACDWDKVGAMMPALEQAAMAALALEGERLHTYTHLSHVYAQGASVYSSFVYRLSGDYGRDLARWQRLKAAVCEAIQQHGGTISHQHGVGQDHAPYLAREKGAIGLSAMRQLVQHFDPQACMNPGTLLPPQQP